MEKLVLIDGHSILNRAFYGVPNLTNSEGLHTKHRLLRAHRGRHEGEEALHCLGNIHRATPVVEDRWEERIVLVTYTTV